MTKSIYIIAEIGVNHNGDLGTAIKLIEYAKKAGASAVKFQSFDVRNLLSLSSKTSKYQSLNLKKEISQFDLLSSLTLKDSEMLSLYEYCNKIKIDFISTPFDIKSANFLYSIGLKKIKISSGDLTDTHLLSYVSKKFDEIILSTGMSNFKDIFVATDLIKSHCSLSLLHCVSSYPAPKDQCNLKIIPLMNKIFNCDIGWSDHTLGNTSSIIALSLGAKIIEKHITLDKKQIGPDHKMSMDVIEFKAFIESLNDTIKYLGKEEKDIQPSEYEASINARKSLAVSKDLKKNHILSKKDILFLRPGTGIKILDLKKVLGLRVNKFKKKSEILYWSDLKY